MNFSVMVPYDPTWRDAFEAEREVLQGVLAPWLTVQIEHVGSTAIPGMAAKPVVDMIAGVRDLRGAHDAFEVLEALEYQYRPHRPEAHLFNKPSNVGWESQTHHLHLTETGSALWQERLGFRDALREDPELVVEYNAWKVRHSANVTGATEPYSESKWPFVARTLQRKGVHLQTDAQRLIQPSG